MDDYEKLLEKGRKEIPENMLKNERFKIPKVKGHLQGNKTVISNFYQIAEVLGREPDHMLKYILKSLAAPGELKKNALIIGTKLSSAKINEKIQQYADTFVICSECKKPDTKLEKEGKVLSMKCLACGAKHPIKA